MLIKSEKVYENGNLLEEENNDVDNSDYRLKHRLTKAKKMKEIEKQATINSISEDSQNKFNETGDHIIQVKKELQDIDLYTKILLSKPNKKEGRKLTRFDFVLLQEF